MALYVIYKVAPNGYYTELGKVRAKNLPQAILKAYKKFGISENEDQRRIGARPVVKVKAKPLPLTEDEKAFARQLLGGMRKLMG